MVGVDTITCKKTSIAGKKEKKWHCLNSRLNKSKDRWQICLKNTSNQNTTVNLNNLLKHKEKIRNKKMKRTISSRLHFP